MHWISERDITRVNTYKNFFHSFTFKFKTLSNPTTVAILPKKGKTQIKKKECRVIDTSLLIDDPDAIYELGKRSDVRLPIGVLAELGRLQSNGRRPAIQHVAGEVLEKITQLLGTHPRFNGGISIPGTDHLMHVDTVEQNSKVFTTHPDGKTMSTQIIATCLKMRAKYKKVLLVTKDKSLRLQAAAMNIDTEYYERDITPCYQGNEVVATKPEITFLDDDQKVANRFFIVDGDKAGVWVLRKSGTEFSFERIEMLQQKRLGITTRNIEQVAAAWALFNPVIKFVSLQGEAGCGKTFLSILAGISGILDGKYDKIIITRAMTAVDGEGLGALPGDASQKISPYMGGVYDNIAAIKRLAIPYFGKDKKKLKEFEDVLAKNIEAIPFDLMRGRTLDRTFLIIDEAQNTTTHAMKMLLTRVSDNSKVAVMGDNKQIDDPYLDSRSNGMAKAIKTFKDFPEAAHITLKANERGSVSRHASQMK